MSESILPSDAAQAVDKCTCRLAVAFQRHIDAETLRVYRETMSDLPLWAIERAEMQLRRKGGDFFPTAAAWHETATNLMQESQRIPSKGDSKRSYECDACRDTGWFVLKRDDCEFYVECSCRPTNSTYQLMTARSRHGSAR